MVFSSERDGWRLAALARATDASVDHRTLERIGRYCELVAQWNARTDLVAARDAEALVEVLGVDAFALYAAELLPAEGRVLDVGAGAGAPTLPLLLARSGLQATLVEPRRRRVAFLRTAVGALGLGGRVDVLERRVDPERPAIPGAPYDLALSRATFAPDVWLRVGLSVAHRVVVLTATEQPPPPPEGTRCYGQRAYRVPSTGAPRCASAYART